MPTPLQAATPSKPTFDPGSVNKLFDKLLEKARHQRYQFERDWFQGVLYYSGSQWVVWDRDKRQWRKKQGPRWFPTPVTNVLAEKVEDNVASLIQETPAVAWVPETEDPEDIATAEVADRVDEVVADETGRERMKRRLATWVVVCGDGFVESYYDNSPEHGTAFLHYKECSECGFQAGPKDFRLSEGKCPQCSGNTVLPAFEITGSRCSECGLAGPVEMLGQECPQCLDAMMQAATQPAMDPMAAPQAPALSPMGEPAAPPQGMEMGAAPPVEPPTVGTFKAVHGPEKVGEQVPRGKLCQKVRSAFEVFFDHPRVDEFTPDGGLRWVVTVDLIDQDEAKDKYGLSESELSGGESAQDSSLSKMYRESLAVLTSDGYSGSGQQTYRGTGRSGEQVVVETLHMLPTTEYPDGLHAVRVNGSNGRVIDPGPLPYHDTNGKPFLPIVHFPFKIQAGRIWGKTIVSDIIPLQDQRNQAEAMMKLCEQRMANPVWLLPKGMVERAPTGEPGETVWYRPFGDGMGKQQEPKRVEGVDPGQYFRYRIESLDMKIEQLSGSFGVAHGEPPPGVTAASALALLAERQGRQVSPQTRAWEQSWERVAWQQMMIFREYAADTRVRAIKGNNSAWQVEKWSSADLSGRINARVEVGSATPKSQATQRAQVEALTRMGAVNLMDPNVQHAVLERFGETDLVGHTDSDIKTAQKEQERWLRLTRNEEGGELPTVEPLFDNHAVHATEHIKFGKTDDYREVKRRAMAGDDVAAAFVTAFESHLQEHMQAVQIAEQEAMAKEQAAAEAKNAGPGRPSDSGAVLSRGARAPQEEGTRSVLEPRDQ